MEIRDVASHIYEIGDKAGRLDKERLLKQYAEVPGFKETLRHIFNPLTRTGIAAKKLENIGSFQSTHPAPTLKEALNYFYTTTTGSDMDVHFAARFIKGQLTPLSEMLATAIVTKDLKIGVTETTLNKIYGKGFIPVIECMLGVEYSKANPKKGLYISSRKIDGVRRLLIKKDGVVTMFSRNGLPDSGLVEIEAAALHHLPDNWVFDGELEAVCTPGTSNLAIRQRTNSLANRKGDRRGLVFNVFDMIPVDEFEAGESKFDVLTRKAYIAMLFNDEDSLTLLGAYNMLSETQRIKPTPVIKATPIVCVSDSFEEHELAFKKLVDAGEEGLMMILATSKYVPGKRSKEWVKMKKFESIDLPITGFIEGGGRLEGKLGAVTIQYKGAMVSVGSGFSDAEREEVWNNAAKYKGVIIEIMHQGESKNQLGGVSLNCPIFKGFRYDKMPVVQDAVSQQE